MGLLRDECVLTKNSLLSWTIISGDDVLDIISLCIAFIGIGTPALKQHWTGSAIHLSNTDSRHQSVRTRSNM